MSAIVLAFGSAAVGAIVGSILTWYLQRRWTHDPAAEVVELRKEVAAIRGQLAEFKQNVEATEKERAEFEYFPLAFSLQQGAPGGFTGVVKNDSKHKVSIETVQILRGDTNHESPLTEPVKPRGTDDWTLEPGTGKTIHWAPQGDPKSMLRTLERSSDPKFPEGRVIPIALVLAVRVDGKQLRKKQTQQVLFQGNQILPHGP
jgi:hypothetical protein